MANSIVGSNLKTPKALTLKQLTASAVGEQPTLQDLSPNISGSPNVVSTPSNYNNAAYAAMLSNDASSMIDTFKSSLAEGEQDGVSSTAQQIHSQAADQAQPGYADAATNVLANPNVPDDQKRAAVQMAYDKNSLIYSPSNLLSMKGLETPSKVDDTPEGSESRYQVGDYIQGIVKANNDRQAIYNAVKTQVDPTLTSKAYNFITGLIPGVNEARQAKLMSDIGQGSFIKNFVKSFAFNGGAKADLNSYLDGLSPEQSVAAASNIADVLSNHTNPVVSTPNDEARRQMLDLTLSGNGYSTQDKVIDTVGAWGDALIIGGPLVKALKGAKAVSGEVKAADAFTEASNAAKNEAVDTSSVVDPAAAKIEPNPPTYNKVNKNSLGQFQRSREKLVYNSSNGIPYVNNPETKISSAIRDALRSDVQPVSVFENVKNTNPDMAQALYDDVTSDATGEAAKAVSGTTRTDALASPVLPEVEHLDGSVAAKVTYPDAVEQTRKMLPPEVVDFFDHQGLTHYEQSEKAKTIAWKVNEFQNAIGMTPRNEMFQMLPDMSKYETNPQGFSWRSVHGPANSGFSNPEDALETAKFALSNTGIPESSLGLLRRDGANYVPTSLDEINQLGDKAAKDYLVTVDHDYRVNSADVNAADKSAQELGDARVWSKLSVKRNWTDVHMISSGRSGKLSNYLFSFGDQLHKTIYLSSLQQADKVALFEKSLLRQADDFAKGWKTLSRDKQVNLLSEINEANVQSRNYDFNSLSAKGFSAEDMDVLRNFKKVQDVSWHLRNRYLSGQLDKAGFEEFVHNGSATNMPVRRMAQQSVKGSIKHYNPATGNIEQASANDIETLYKNGGGVAKLRQPIIDSTGDVVEHVLHSNNSNEGYLRKFTSSSKVLNYRPGYFQVKYKDPFFIIEQVNGGKANAAKGGFDKAVSTARDSNEAKTIASRLSAQGNPHYFRPSKEFLAHEIPQNEVDLSMAQGMSAFRRRGKLLEDTTSPVTNLALNHIQNPVESMTSGIVSLSKKIVMQDNIDAIKQRAVSYYSDLLPKNNFQDPLVPKDLRDIRYRNVGDYNWKHIADARATFAYANMLESGYVNMLDDGIKSTLNIVADIFGHMNAPKAERVARALSDKSLTRGAKSSVYHAFIGLAPQRQILIQGQQAALTAAINPKWVASAKAFGQPMYLALRTMGMDVDNPMVKFAAKSAWGKDSEKVFAQFQRTGITAAIDHQSFVSGAVNDMAKNMIANSRQGTVNAALQVPRKLSAWSRKIGFDAGEFYSNSMSWAAHRDLAEAKGLDVFSDSVADTVAGQARNYTGAMNFAGDLPTNKNALSLVFQFTQNTQKMLLNATTNRSIDTSTKLALAPLSVALYGLPTGIVMGYLSSIQDPDAKELLSQGLEGWTLNKMLTTTAGGEKSDIDWGGLSPFNNYGTLDMIQQMWSQPMGKTLSNTPAASLMFGSNPRVANAVASLGRYFNPSDDFKDPDEFLNVVSDFAKISSGYSDILKAKVLWETHKKISSSNRINGDDQARVNAIGVGLGFPTIQEGINYYIQNQNREQKQSRINDVDNWYKVAKEHYLGDLLNDRDLAYTQKVMNAAHLGFGDDEFANRELGKLLKQDLNRGQAELFNQALRNSEMYKHGDAIKMIDNTPFANQRDKDNLKALITFGNQYEPEGKE